MNVHELSEMIRSTIHVVNDDLHHLRAAVREWAVADNAYRLARARVFLETSGSVAARNAQADLVTGDERERARLAEGMQQAALEAIRAHRTELTALQTLANAHRAEAEFVRTSPFEEPPDVRRFDG